jgi:predicted nucleotidyltransferase
MSPAMFDEETRKGLRATLVARAEADPRVVATALTGSAALDREDHWSDIDLAPRLDCAVDEADVCADWTTEMYQRHGAVHHLDI